MIDDVINQLKAVLPKYTDDFSTNLVVSSLTRSGSTVTATTVLAHGLVAGDKALITGAKTPLLITSLTRVGEYAIALFSSPHSLVPGIETTVITGAVESEYNGTKTIVWNTPVFNIASITTDGAIATVTTFEDHGFLVDANFEVQIAGVKPFSYNQTVHPLTIPTSKSFTCAINGTEEDGQNMFGQRMNVRQVLNSYNLIFEVDSSATTPATGTIYQLTGYQDGYNGYKTVLTAPTEYSITYAISTTPLSPAQGTIVAKTNPTIDCLPDQDKMEKTFISQFNAKDSTNWVYFIPGLGNTSRDKSMSTDAIAQLGIGSSTRLCIVESFDIYAFIKTANSNYYTDAMVKARNTDLRAMVGTLVNYKPTSPFSDGYYTGIVLVNHGQYGIIGQHYIHRYSFETHNYISNQDQVTLPDSVPLRTVNINIMNPEQDNYVLATVNAQVDEEN